MISNITNEAGGGKNSLPVEWHDCAWQPAIRRGQGGKTQCATRTKRLSNAVGLPHSVGLCNLDKPMKKIGNRKSEIRNVRAFTLIELLVVIAIIGILAAMLMTVLPKARDAANKAKAQTEMTAIVAAINAYDQDYSRFPLTAAEQTAAGTNDFTTGQVAYSAGTHGFSFDNNSNTIAILMDMTAYPNGTATANANHVKNPKQVKYLAPKLSGYDPASNDPHPPGGVDITGIYRDPWGNPYIITMNSSYNEQGTSDNLYSLQSVSQNGANSKSGYNGLFNPVDANGNGDHFLYHGKVMVWSAGVDGKYDIGAANTGVNKDNVLSW